MGTEVKTTTLSSLRESDPSKLERAKPPFAVGDRISIRWPSGMHLETDVYAGDSPDAPDDLYVAWPPDMGVNIWAADPGSLTPPFADVEIDVLTPTQTPTAGGTDA